MSSVPQDKPCKKCGKTERYANGKCAVCARERASRHYRANHEQKLDYQREYRQNNRAEIRKSNRRYRQENPEIQKRAEKKWRGNNLGITRARNHRFRARTHGASGNWTADQFQALVDYYGDLCLSCGKLLKLEADHVIPLTEGGSNDIGNIQPLCRSCNAQKHNKTIDYRPDEGSFAKQLAEQA